MVGLVGWDLHLAGCRSLKDKRRVIKSIKDRLHRQFNVSVAETDCHDLWQRAQLTCCVVSRDEKHASDVLTSADKLVASDSLARIIDSWRELR
ncbi:MAG: DUF503 domain-containing protein [Gemmatimonadales bacterium]